MPAETSNSPPCDVESFRRRIAGNPPKRILVIARDHIGDLANSTAALGVLRRSFPTAKLVVEAGARAVPILAGHPDADEVIARKATGGTWGRIARVIGYRAGHYDLAVVLDDGRTHVRLAKLAGIPLRAGIFRGKSPELFSVYASFDQDHHETLDSFRSLLEVMGLDVSDYRPHLYPSPAHFAEVETLLGPAKRPLVGFQATTTRQIRQWPSERFVELGRRLQERGVGVVLTGSPEEVELLLGIAHDIGGSAIVAAGRLSLLGSAALMPRLAALVTGDTGPMHIAAAMGTPVVALFGPSDHLHSGPYGDQAGIIVGECTCGSRTWRNCTGHCLQSISVEAVFGRLEAIGALTPLPNALHPPPFN